MPFAQQRARDAAGCARPARRRPCGRRRGAGAILRDAAAVRRRRVDAPAPAADVVGSRRAPRARPRGRGARRWCCCATSRSTAAGAAAGRRAAARLAVVGRLADVAEHGRPRLVRRPRAAVRGHAARGPRGPCSARVASCTPTAPTRRRRRPAAGADAAVVVVGYTRRGRGRVRRVVRPRSWPCSTRRARRARRRSTSWPGSWDAGPQDASGGDRASLRLHPDGRGPDPGRRGREPAHRRRVMAGAAVVTEGWRHEVPAVLVPGTRAWRAGTRSPTCCSGGPSPAAGCRSRSRATRPTCRPSTGTPRASSTTAGTASGGSTGTASPAAYPLGFGLAYTTFTIGDVDVRPGADGDVEVRAAVTNTGERTGGHVVQVYVDAAGVAGTGRRALPRRLRAGGGGRRRAAGCADRRPVRAARPPARTGRLAASARRLPLRRRVARGGPQEHVRSPRPAVTPAPGADACQ